MSVNLQLPLIIEKKEKNLNLFDKLNRSLTILLLIISGIFLGLSHLEPSLWIFAWFGIILTTISLHFSKNKTGILIGLFLGGFAAQWVGHPWYMSGVNRFGGGTWDMPKTIIAWLIINLSMVLPERFPLIFTSLIFKLKLFSSESFEKSEKKNIFIYLSKNLYIWVPISILIGEWCNLRLSGLSQASWLYSQWQVIPVLRSVGSIGWTLTNILCLTICVLIGEAIFFKSAKKFVFSIIGLFILLMMPSLPNDIPPILNTIGAVHFSSYANRPKIIPDNVKLLIWPELSRSGRPRISEGLKQNLKLEPPLISKDVFHIIGQETRIKEGLQNSILALDSQGNLLSSRAKKFLFPGGERVFLGFHVPHRKPYIPGEIPPYIEVNGIRVTALLCFEELDHSLAIEGAKAGSKLLTVSAIEETMGDTIEVQNQFIGVGVFLAVETNLPVVRASLVGPAAIIAPDGRVLAFSDSLTNGILTLK